MAWTNSNRPAPQGKGLNQGRTLQSCPTCEGDRVVIDLRYGRPRRLKCRTCAGTGTIDAGVWPYEPWTPLNNGQTPADLEALEREHFGDADRGTGIYAEAA